MGSAAAGYTQPLISMLWKQVPEAGECSWGLKIELAWVQS